MDPLKYRPMRRPLMDMLRWAFNKPQRWGHNYAEEPRRDAERPERNGRIEQSGTAGPLREDDERR